MRLLLLLVLSFILSGAPSFGAEKINCAAVASGQLAPALTFSNPITLAKEIQGLLNSSLTSSFWMETSQDEIPLSLSVDTRLYSNTKFVPTSEYRVLKPGETMIEGVRFGYIQRDSKVTKGTLNYVILRADGSVAEVGGGSRKLIDFFKQHLFGRVLTAAQKVRIQEINRMVFDALSADHDASVELSAFEKKRGWPQGFAKQNGLVLLNSSKWKILQWANSKKISHEDLALAGWVRLTFSPRGKPSFATVVNHAVLIPFLDRQTADGILSWRMRNLEDEGPRYLSWPKDRSYSDEDVTGEALFNRWKLTSARGKAIILTEGEFKCMVSESQMGLVTLGIPGITQFTRAMAQEIKNAVPKEVIVILDRDPRGKGYRNVDGLTDSQRAAYSIAMVLKEAGVPVRVGRIPDAFNGGKAGIDDVLLKHPYGKALIQGALKTATSPEEYAKLLGISPELLALRDQQSLLGRAVKGLKENRRRGNSVNISELDEARVDNLLSALKERLRSLFSRMFPGRKSWNSPWLEAEVLETDGRLVLMDDAGQVRIMRSSEEVAVLNFDKRCSPGFLQAELEMCRHAVVKSDFPEDDFLILENRSVKNQHVPFVIVKKETGQVMAFVHFGSVTLPSTEVQHLQLAFP